MGVVFTEHFGKLNKNLCFFFFLFFVFFVGSLYEELPGKNKQDKVYLPRAVHTRGVVY